MVSCTAQQQRRESEATERTRKRGAEPEQSRCIECNHAPRSTVSALAAHSLTPSLCVVSARSAVHSRRLSSMGLLLSLLLLDCSPAASVAAPTLLWDSPLAAASRAAAGPKTTFANTLHTKTLCDFSNRTISEAYERTEALQGKGTISIDEIRILLSYVYNGLPPEREIGLLTRIIDFDQRGPVLPGHGAENGILLRVTLPQLLEAVEKVRAQVEESLEFKRIAGNAQVAQEFKSYDHQEEHRHKHLRSKYDPQDKYVKPITTSQEIGWFSPAQVERVDRIPNISCPETRFAAFAYKRDLMH